MSKAVMLRTIIQVGIVILLLTSVRAFSQETSFLSSDDSTSQAGPSAGDADAQDKVIAVPPADSAESPIRRLGTPFPLDWKPQGLKLGPFYMTGVSVSAFHEESTPPNQPSSALWGSVVNSDFVLNHQTQRGEIAVQVNPYVTVIGSSAYLNQNAGVNFTSHLTARLSLNLGTSTTYLQNSYLQNPQYLLGYTGTGFVLQKITAQYRGSSFDASNNFSLDYQMSGRTQISIVPVVGATILNQFGEWSWVEQFGAGVVVSRSFNPDRTGSISYNVVHSTNSLQGSISSSSWMTQTFMVGLQQRIKHSWWISGNIGASMQQEPLLSWTPTGNLSVMKSFRKSSITAAYTRTRADQVLLTTGYFDQADLAYAANLSRKWQFNVGVGEYRTVEVTSNSHGKRVNGALYYQLFPSCSLFAQYNYVHQSGTNASLFEGVNSYMSFGLRWTLNHRPGV
jgi:hypothetical protein